MLQPLPGSRSVSLTRATPDPEAAEHLSGRKGRGAASLCHQSPVHMTGHDTARVIPASDLRGEEEGRLLWICSAYAMEAPEKHPGPVLVTRGLSQPPRASPALPSLMIRLAATAEER